jgi:hypothetical protein
MSLWFQIGLLVLTGASLALHASHNKKLNALGDDVDIVKAAVSKDSAVK